MAFTGTYICTALKTDLWNAVHNIAAHTFKMALYTNSATLDASTAAYTVTGETSGAGYSSGGKALAGVALVVNGTTTSLTFTSPTWTAVSLTARGALIYNSSAIGKNALVVLDFGSDKVKSGTDLTVQIPSTGIIQEVS